MGLIWTLIVGALIGVIAGALTKKGGSMGWIANIAAGLVGSSVGQALLGLCVLFFSRNVFDPVSYWCRYRCYDHFFCTKQN